MRKTKIILVLLILGSPALRAQQVHMEWSKSMGGAAADMGQSIVTDAAGNVYTTGVFKDTADFDPGPGTFILTSRGNSDSYISKLDAAGNFAWAVSFGGISIDFAYSIAADDSGNVYATGYFRNTVDFDPGFDTFNLTAVDGEDIFIVKLDSSGKFVWAKSMGGTRTDQAYSIAIDAAGNVYTTGYFNGPADFDPGTGASDTFFLTPGTSRRANVFISKLDAAGNFVWARNLGSTDNNFGRWVTTDQWGNVYLTGDFTGTAYLYRGAGTDSLVGSAQYTNLFVIKLDSSGSLKWAKTSLDNNGGNAQGYSLATDSSGNVYCTGNFYGTVDFNPGSGSAALTANSSSDIFVAKWDASGAFLWVRQIGGASEDLAAALKTDASGNIYITGSFGGTADFDPDTAAASTFLLTSNGGADIFIAKLDAHGNFVWAKAMGGTLSTGTLGNEQGNGITVDGSGNIYTTGRYSDSKVDFDPGVAIFNLDSKRDYDIFVQKLACYYTSFYSYSIEADCHGYTANRQTYTTSGIYRYTLPNAAGCDSNVVLHLTITLPEAIISINKFELGTTRAYVAYQWFLDGKAIPGAINSTYLIKSNGDYTVVVTDANGCSDTSEIYTVTNYTGIEQLANLVPQVKIYPNPAGNIIYIEAPCPVHISLTDIEGKVIRQADHASSVALDALPKGIYFLHITDRHGNFIKMEKIVKNSL